MNIKSFQTLSRFRDETQGVWSVLSWSFSTFSRALYQDADIYLLDDPLSTVDAEISRHLFEQWVYSCFLSSMLSRNSVETREESSGKPLYFGRLSLFCLVSLSPLPSPHRSSITEKFCIMLRSGQENRAGASTVWRTAGSVLREWVIDGRFPPATRSCWIQTPGIRRMMNRVVWWSSV